MRSSGRSAGTSYNGSIAEAFYQPVPFVASDDVNVLYPKFPPNKHIAIFLCTLIRQEKYRFNYGRKWHAEKMRESVIRLPSQIVKLELRALRKDASATVPCVFNGKPYGN